MKEIYRMTKEELKQRYGTLDGLSSKQAEQLLEQYGENRLEEKNRKSTFCVFVEQFADLLVVILIIAAIVSIFSGNGESSFVIFAVIILNAVLGTVQYVKAEKSLDSLRELSSPKAKVLRDKTPKEVLSKEVVPGDILLLEAGDVIVADGRILENFSLQVNESSLTGESANVDKKEGTMDEDAALAERYNMVFSGSLVTYGRAHVLVTGTGMNTEIGKIAALMNDTKSRKTPLQVSLDNFSKVLAFVIILISIFVFGIRIWQGEEMLPALMFAVALMVAAIPEALGSIVTIVQAMGTRKMAADNAIIKDLKAVESLGCVSVICSDKTGTLTQNKMTVQQIYIDDKCLTPEELKLTSALHRYLLYNAVLNNDSSIQSAQSIGDPTETCLLDMARKGFTEAGITEEDIRSLMPRMEEIPFDSERKLMSTKYRVHGIPTVFTKGAVDVLLGRTTRIYAGGEIRRMTEQDKEKILRQNREFSEKGLRVLAFAYKECGENAVLDREEECDYIFTGLVSMMDPPREESFQAVASAVRAGIKPIMITGDHKVTATAIARQIGIYREGDIAITGPELDAMSDEELDEKLNKISVYARVSPENKIRIVTAWQRNGAIAAMTGDGVNDAPALKKADIGVAMGITGTEVAKDASHMILADDNFATIMKAVLNGRNVYRNIINAIQFLLSGNMAAILVVLFCSFLSLSTPFEPVHLLFINLLTDSLPALAIGMEPADSGLLTHAPRDRKTGIFTKKFSLQLICFSILIGVATQTAFYFGLEQNAKTASTMSFATLTLARLFHGFTCRSEHSVFRIGLTGNKWSIAAFAAGVVLLLSVLLIPVMQNLFLTAPLHAIQWLEIIVLAFLPTLCVQIFRYMKESVLN